MWLSTWDYHLRLDSPAVDAGLTIPWLEAFAQVAACRTRFNVFPVSGREFIRGLSAEL